MLKATSKGVLYAVSTRADKQGLDADARIVTICFGAHAGKEATEIGMPNARLLLVPPLFLRRFSSTSATARTPDIGILTAEIGGGCALCTRRRTLLRIQSCLCCQHFGQQATEVQLE